MIYIVFLVMLVLTYINYFISRKDIVAPATIAMISLDMGLFFSILGAKSWKFSMSDKTALVILVGVFSITLANICFSGKRTLSVPKTWKDGNTCLYSLKYIKIATFVSAILTLLYGVDAYRVGLASGGTGLNAFAYMKAAYASSTIDSRMNLFIRQGFKVILAIAYVHLYILVSMIIKKEYQKKCMAYLIFSILCAMMVVIFSGSRTEILQLLSAAIFMYSIRWRESRSWTPRSNRKSFRQIVKKAWPLVFVMMLIGFGSRAIVKVESNTLSATGTFWVYIIYYIGSPFAVLNTKIQKSFSDGGMIFGTTYSGELAHAQVYLGDLNYGGNAATFFTSVFTSGVVGMFLRLFLVVGIGTIIYRSVLINSFDCYKRNRNLIVLSVAYFVFTMAYYADCTGLLTKNNNIFVCIIAILYYKYLSKSMKQM